MTDQTPHQGAPRPGQLTFVVGANRLSQLTDDTGVEVVFAGRSNSGKSSAINAITGQKSIARTSKAPGRTQQINIFAWDDQHRLADLPGYGFARVPAKLKAHWAETLGRYLTTRASLRGLVLVMDIRRNLQAEEWQLLDWGREAGIPALVLLNKADKLGSGRRARAAKSARAAARDYPDAEFLPFSATHGVGLDDARRRLGDWLELQLAGQGR